MSLTAKEALLDLIDLLNLEPGETELAIDFFDRAVQCGMEAGVINDSEADLMVAWLERTA